MDYGQPDYSSSCACGQCNTSNDAIDQNHPLLQLLSQRFNAPYGPNVNMFASQLQPTAAQKIDKIDQAMSFNQINAMMQNQIPQFGAQHMFQQATGQAQREPSLGEMYNPQGYQGYSVRAVEDKTPPTSDAFAATVKYGAQFTELGSEDTLTGLISEVIIPGMQKKIVSLMAEFSGQSLLRQQRRLTARLNKLLSYAAVPSSISPETISDEYELALYKWFVFNTAVKENLSVAKVDSLIKTATEHYATRRAEIETNSARQKKEAQEQEEKIAYQVKVDNHREMVRQFVSRLITDGFSQVKNSAMQLDLEATKRHLRRFANAIADLQNEEPGRPNPVKETEVARTPVKNTPTLAAQVVAPQVVTEASLTTKSQNTLIEFMKQISAGKGVTAPELAAAKEAVRVLGISKSEELYRAVALGQMIGTV